MSKPLPVLPGLDQMKGRWQFASPTWASAASLAPGPPTIPGTNIPADLRIIGRKAVVVSLQKIRSFAFRNMPDV